MTQDQLKNYKWHYFKTGSTCTGRRAAGNAKAPSNFPLPPRGREQHDENPCHPFLLSNALGFTGAIDDAHHP
jgi:hypothetical protein